MIRWNYIAKKLADKYSAPQGFGRRWNPEHLIRCWKSLFDFRIEDHADRQTMSDNYALIYSFVMTLAERENMSDEVKAENILALIKEIAGNVNQEVAGEIFKVGGYNLTTSQEESTQLSQYGSFHWQVLDHCALLFEQGNYFYAVQEASKAYCEAVRQKAGSREDGQKLMTANLGTGRKILAVPGSTLSEENLLEGIKYLSMGLVQAFRNPSAHETMKKWMMPKQDCLDMLSLTSYLLRQLDKATVLP